MAMAKVCPMLGLTPDIWAMKRAATASYKAVPSMLMVAPMGRTNLEILGSTPFFSSRQFMVTGSVAELEAVPQAVVMAPNMFLMNLKQKNVKTLWYEFSFSYLKGNFLQIITYIIGRTISP